LTLCIAPHTLSYMKDALLTLRIPSEMRRRIAAVAARDDRSLSQAAERLIEVGLSLQDGGSMSGAVTAGAGTVAEVRHPWPRSSPPPLAGLFSGGLVPELSDFQEVRSELSASLLGRTRLGRAEPGSHKKVDAKRRR
jgi:hypothetical protein